MKVKFFIVVILLTPFVSIAQTGNMVLKCPFEHGSGREPKEAYTWSPPDRKVIMVSHVDSLIRSAVTGTITNVDKGDDSSYEIVVNIKDMYFWYYGVDMPYVKRGQ